MAVISLQTAPQAPRKPDQLHTVLHGHQGPTQGLGRTPLHVPRPPRPPSRASIWSRAQPGPTPTWPVPWGYPQPRGTHKGFRGVQRAPSTTAQCPATLHSGQGSTDGFKGSAHPCPMSQGFSEWPGAGRGAQWASCKPGQRWRFSQKQPGAYLLNATEFSTEVRG